MITVEKLYAATRGGLDIILYYYPQANEVVGTRNKFRARPNEKTASACLRLSGDVWKVVDFGDDGHGLSPIDICMKEENITHFYEAVLHLAGIFNVQDELNRSVNKPRIEKRSATADEQDGTKIFALLDAIPDSHLKVLGPKVKREHAEALNWHEAEYIGYVKNREVTLKYSTEDYPIFMRECRTDDNKVFYKIYEPLNPEKQWRFSYTPEGVKPKDYINGLRELQTIYGRLNSQSDEDDDAPQREQKLDEVIICSGERDALCCKSMGYQPIWFNSETYQISEDDINLLYRYAKVIYNIPDIDSTGIKKGTELALRHIDVYTIWLPEWLSNYRDNRGKPRKDLRDWQELRRDINDFRDLLKLALPAKFWTETVNEKSGKKEITISAVRLYYFLQLNGFRTLRDINASNTRYIQVTNNIVKQIKAKDVRRFVREWSEERCLNENIRNLIVNSMKFSETSLENLKEVELDFSSFTHNTQMFFFPNNNVEVTPKEIVVHQRGDTAFNHYVWEENVLQHNYKPLPDMFKMTCIDKEKNLYDVDVMDSKSSPIFGYVINTSRLHWRKEMEERFVDNPEEAKAYAEKNRFRIDGEGLTEEEIREQKQNLANKIFAIGYMLHRFKSPSRAWAPQAMDNKIGENGECNGRSGKSFLFKTLSLFMKSVKLSGRNPKLMDNPHVFDQVNIHTDFVLVDDCAQYLSMGLFYDIITSDMSINPKNNQSYSIPFEQSPKFAFTTNYVPADFDASTEARLLYMVFSDYYHQQTESNDYIETRSIRDDFGRDLYTFDYPKEYWNADINFLLQCLRFYLSVCESNVKIYPPMDNIITRKYRQDLGNNFEDWADSYFAEGSANLNKLLVRREVFETYRKYANVSSLTMQTFTKKLRAYCNLCPYIAELNPADMCNAQNRISKRIEGVMEDMIYIKTVDTKTIENKSPAEEKKNEPIEVELPF